MNDKADTIVFLLKLPIYLIIVGLILGCALCDRSKEPDSEDV